VGADPPAKLAEGNRAIINSSPWLVNGCKWLLCHLQRRGAMSVPRIWFIHGARIQLAMGEKMH